jgi:hypothetical protein
LPALPKGIRPSQLGTQGMVDLVFRVRHVPARYREKGSFCRSMAEAG